LNPQPIPPAEAPVRPGIDPRQLNPQPIPPAEAPVRPATDPRHLNPQPIPPAEAPVKTVPAPVAASSASLGPERIKRLMEEASVRESGAPTLGRATRLDGARSLVRRTSTTAGDAAVKVVTLGRVSNESDVALFCNSAFQIEGYATCPASVQS
jgi:hypothetical protein